VLHFDGTAWSMVTVPDVGPLTAVWSVGVDDVWAGGRGAILHLHP